jgi:hypothetical protein
MKLAGVKQGDIVRVAGSFGVVAKKERGALMVQWMKTNLLRRVMAAEVEAHWGRKA